MPVSKDLSCDDRIFMAKLAEQAERYEEMKDYMRAVVEEKKRLGTEERNLLSVAYKNVVGARRASWRVLNSIRSKEADKSSLAEVEAYMANVEKELADICNNVLGLLTNVLLANKEIEHEERVFYFKMKGDYHRYMAEFLRGAESEDTIDEAKNAYKDAMEAAKSLSATDPIRLGLALNFSVFYYEILDKPKTACELAKKAFDTAVGELEDLNEDQYKDATLIMQLLRDNLTLWQSESDDHTGADDGDMEVQPMD